MIIGLFLPQMVAGHLNAGGTLVQRERVRRGLAEVDPVGNATRWGRAVKRRTCILCTVPECIVAHGCTHEADTVQI